MSQVSASIAPEVCSQIVQWVDRRRDLLVLCVTCKAFQRAAECKLYSMMYLIDVNRAQQACRTLITTGRVSYVRTFVFHPDSRRGPIPPLKPVFWSLMQGALNAMRNLESLTIVDPTFSNTWIFDPDQISFQLRESKLRFTWDNHIARFLEGQKKLRVLQFYERQPISATIDRPLPSLRMLDSCLSIATQLISSPISNMQVVMDVEDVQIALTMLRKFANLHKTLRALNLLDIVDDNVSLKIFNSVSRSCPQLIHLGLLPLPVHHRHKFHHCLMDMHSLRSIELDIARWTPPPPTIAQRALAAELKIYCPTICTVTFWIGGTRCRWLHDGMVWISQSVDLNQYPNLNRNWHSV
ncbi:hypothetical protein BDQ12DRAFT_630043 [Crucibulum laeve]|uniref:F-box domain-containing protein n=1 Tax=Crucibulum laeve TaxID=68775 RepID=A0A5C3M1T2_9AGAR|nr:hypothetical protein BDQ12DRAFT_630043 [Crucibulum laeve]